MVDIKLKRCPFCGGEAVVFVARDYGVKVGCKKCPVSTFWEEDSVEEVFENKPSAIERVVSAWNRRCNNG